MRPPLEFSGTPASIRSEPPVLGADTEAVLREAGLVRDERRGNQVFYRLECPCITSFYGCVESVTRAINECEGVEETLVDLAAGRARVRGSGFDRSALAEAVRSLGFEVEVNPAD